jgi:hypothetical protein
MRDAAHLSISSGSPVVYALTSQDRFGVSHLGYFDIFGSSDHRSPLAMWRAFLTSDYYGDSVTLGLAPFRPSRVPLVLNVSCVTSASHSSPSMKSFFIA